MNSKICTKCKETRLSTEFYKDDRHSDGLFSQCVVCMNIYKRKHYQKSYQKYREISKKYRQNNKKERKDWLEKTKVKNKQVALIYKQKNKEKIVKYNLEYRKRPKTETQKLLINIRTRINRALKQNYKNTTTKELLGCSIVFLKQYLEARFLKGMNWNNHSRTGWHIDHIRPCDSFDLSKPLEQRKCFSYHNLQPLWATVNLTKGKTYDKL